MAQITTSQFAAELGTDGRTARKFLRSITPKEKHPGKGSRWEIDGTKRSLTSMKKRFSEWHSAQAAEKAKAEKAEVTETEDEDDLDD